VQTVCTFCHSILVRHDLDLQRVGEVADLPPDPSPIQLRTEGQYRNKAFQVVGRIIYEYENGGWNEWHIVFNDGSSGWLSDAQAEYAVSFQVTPKYGIPSAADLRRGYSYRFEGAVVNGEQDQRTYVATTLTDAHYKGVEGELPFEYWDKETVVFVDLRSIDGHFGTIDYSENPPLLFLGEIVEFENLKLTNIREFEGWKRP
jgi:hypothetical protein